MSILSNFTIKNLKLNKKRTIVTIIGIILSTALICAVSGMVTSTKKTFVNMITKSEGNYHVCFNDVSKEGLKYIKQNSKINLYFYSSNLGYAKLEGTKNQDKPYVYIKEYDKTGLENSGFNLTEGRMPENSDEIVISKHIIDNARVNLKIGDNISLDIGTRQLNDGTKLSQINPYETSENGENLEEIVNTYTKEYKIVGIIERPSLKVEGISAPGYTIISYNENIKNLDSSNISVVYKSAKGYDENTKQILNELEEKTGAKVNTITNVDLLRFEGGLSDANLKILYGIAAVVIVIIVISSIFVIRNSFSISVSEKTKQYGMLTSIGATKKQIRKTVLLEGLIIGIIAIPLGIICGIIAIISLVFIVNILLGDMLNGIKFIYDVPLIPIGISVIISLITIYLSCIIPAIKAGKISPIEAIRGNDDVKIKSKKIKVSKLTKKLFGIGGVIASKNLKRNRKKYRTTIISLVVSISIFISLSSFLEYGKKMTGVYYTDLSFNIAVSGENKSIYEEIVKFDNISKYSYSYQTSSVLDIDKYGTDYGKEVAQKYKEEAKEYNDDAVYNNNINVVLLSNDYFKSFLKELGCSETDYNNIGVLEDDTIKYNEDGSKEIKHYYNISKDDKIELNINNIQKNVNVIKISDKRPMGYESSYSNGGWLFVSEDFIKDKSNMHLESLNIKSSDATALENKLIDLKSKDEKYKDIRIMNLELYANQSYRMILLVSIFLYGFIAVITLIGVTNIFNTITTNMILRSKEFANLKSIGMTSKEFNKMIRLESILYGLKSLIIGIPIGILGSYYIYNSFANGLDFGYFAPWESIIISILFVFVIVGLTMKYSLNKINKQNIIETIRQDNI